jgi:hypothetical protein
MPALTLAVFSHHTLQFRVGCAAAVELACVTAASGWWDGKVLHLGQDCLVLGMNVPEG